MAAGDGRQAYRSVSGDISGPPSASNPVANPGRVIPAGGQGSPVRLIEGLDGVLSSTQAMTREVGNLAAELKIVNERQRTMYGTQASTSTPGVPADQNAMVQAVRQAIEQAAQSLSAPKTPSSGPSPSSGATSDWLPVPYTAPAPRDVADAATGHNRPYDDPGVPRGPGAAPGAPPPRSAQEEYHRLRDYKMSNLRQDLGQRVSARLENATWGQQYAQDPLGNWRTINPQTGEFGAEWADKAAVAGFMRREGVMASMRDGAGALSGGSTIGEAGLTALGAGAARMAGGAGLALAAANKIGDFAVGQRAANREWVATSGGDQREAFEERLRSNVFQFMRWGVMGEQDAERLYSGVADTGMNREQRNNAQDFAIDAYKDLGMTVAQSLDIIQFAAKNNQESLAGLAEALRDVTEAARGAGVNTEVARQSFVENWKTFSGVFSGTAATSLAAGFGVEKAELGREFQNLDFSGIAGGDQIRMVAASNGMTYNEVLGQSMGRGGEAKFAQMWTDRSNELISDQLGPRANAKIMETVNNRPNPKAPLSEVEMRELEQELLSDPSYGIADTDLLADALSQLTGVSGLDGRNSLKYAIRSLTGEIDGAKATRKQVKRGKTRALAGWDEWKNPTESGAPKKTGNATVDAYAQYYGTTNTSGEGGTGNDRVDAYGQYSADHPAEPDSEAWERATKGIDRDSELGQAWVADALKTGRVGGISSILAQKGEALGVDKIAVQTEGGERVVDLEEAMQFFRDQIDAGTATVAAGENVGSTLADVAATKGDKSVKVTSDEDEGLADIGTSKKDFAKNAKGSGGTVTIQPSPYLLRYFQFSTTGAAEVDTDTHREPPAQHVGPDGRPSGSAY